MKKSIIVLCICLSAIGCAFAGKANIALKVSPYAIQAVSAESGKYTSTYGYGGSFGFRYNVWDKLDAGVDLSVESYKFAELPSDYMVVNARAVAGYTYDFTDRIFARGELGLEVSARSIGKKTKANFGIHAYLGGGCRLSDEFGLTAGCGLDLGFPKGASTKSLDFSAQPEIGFLMAL